MIFLQMLLFHFYLIFPW